jgi:hypothetical protein
MSRLRPVQKIVGETNPRQDWRARAEPKVQKFIDSLSISEMSVSHPASAAGTFSCLFSVWRTPICKSVIFGGAGNFTIRFLPGKLAAISTHTSFSWCFWLMFLYTVFFSSVPVCNFQVI